MSNIGIYNESENMKEYYNSNTPAWIAMVLVALFIIFQIGLGWYLLKQWGWI